MKTRNLSELYTIVLTYRKSLTLEDVNQFICHAINKCTTNNLISHDENIKLFTHFERNRPNSKQHIEFYKSPLIMSDFNSAWWCLTRKDLAKGVAIRDRFLEKMIKITKR